jgi:hypothetical protein
VRGHPVVPTRFLLGLPPISKIEPIKKGRTVDENNCRDRWMVMIGKGYVLSIWCPPELSS